MSNVNVCLKRGFIILTCLIGIISGLTLGLTLFGHGFFHSTDDIEDMIVVLKVLYAIATATFLLAAIGVYGAAKDKSWLLIIFSTGMSLTVLFVAFDLLAIIIFKKEAMKGAETEHRGYWQTPLDTSNATNLPELYEMQESLHCCGVEKGYQDWGSHIHASCVCSEDEGDCIPAPTNSSLSDTIHGTVMVYRAPCLPVLMKYVHLLMSIMIAILTSVVIFWSVSLVLSILIVVQLRRKIDVPPVYYSAEAKAGNYASLAENADME